MRKAIFIAILTNMRCLFSLLSVLTFSCLAAQDSKVVKTEKEGEVLKGSELFFYTDFQPGTVVFRDETSVSARLNYHKLSEEFMFINEAGDSLAIGNPETIRYITINKDTFFYDKSYLYKIYGTEALRLAQKQSLKPVEEKKNSAYGSSFTERSISGSGNNYKVDGRASNGKPHLQYAPASTFSIENIFFLSYKNNEFVQLNKKSILALFPDKSQQLKNFIREKNTDFTSKEEVTALVKYLQTL